MASAITASFFALTMKSLTMGSAAALLFGMAIVMRMTLNGVIRTVAPGTSACTRPVDGFDQDEAESKRDERAVILRRLLASKCIRLKRLSLPTACSMRARAL